jgi:hypothetical protein
MPPSGGGSRVSVATIDLVPVTIPTTDPRDRCPKCDAQLGEIHLKHVDDPMDKGRLIGWECGACGYRDMIRETFAARRRR